MATPTYTTVLDQINAYIVANGSNDITANVLNPILQYLLNFSNNNIGDLSTLTTSENNSVVESINSLKDLFENLTNNGVQLHTGINDPNSTPPIAYNYADFYMQLDVDDLPVKLWQWNGFEWADTSKNSDILLNQYSSTPSDWNAQSYTSGQVVFYGGKQWIAKMAAEAGDVPSVSSKWEDVTFEALANKNITVDQTIIDGSTNAVSGNAVFDGLANKFTTPTGLTTNYLPKWNGSGLVNSQVFEDINGVKIGSDITQDGANEYNGVQIKAISPTEITKAGRGLNVINKYSGNFASTAIQVKTLIEGANNQDHAYGVQSWQYGNGTGLINQVAGYMSAFNNNTNTISNYYSFLANSAVGSNIFNSWGFYTFGGITSYMNKLIVGDTPSSSNTPYFLVSRAAYSDGAFGITSNNITAMSSSDASIGKGGVISLGGKKANGDNSEYQFAFLKGSTQSVSNHLSAFEIYTTSGGGDGEVDSGNYKRYYTDGESHKFYGKNNTIAVEISKNGTISASPAITSNQVPTKAQLDLKADLASPNLTGVPTAPTATLGTNTTQIATTSFVLANGARPYKVYTALLTQTGTNAPTATVLENTLGGAVVWSRTSQGVYIGTLSGVFTLGKTFCVTNDVGQNGNAFTRIRQTANTNTIEILTTISGTTNDSILANTSIEIRVYN